MNRPANWLLLDFSDELSLQLYEKASQPDPWRLFDGTALAGCAEQSPLIVNADRNPELLHAFQQQPEQWPGLLLQSAHPLPLLLEHLRHILFIRFDSERKGVLRYYSPRTASYFFSADPTALASWLGPIQRLSWQGATWQQQAEGRLQAHVLDNPAASAWQALAQPPPLHISPDQANALQQQQADKFLYQWWQGNSTQSYSQASQWLQEGLHLGFQSAEGLSEYLGIRQQHPASPLPSSLPAGNETQRLRQLRLRLQDKQDRESLV